MISLACVDPKDVPTLWRGCETLIDAGFTAADMLVPDDILEQLKSGTRLLWLAVDQDQRIVAAMLTQLFVMRSGTLCKMMECGGERLREWKHLRLQIEEYAKREGCDRVVVEGRPGWARILNDYKVIAVTLEKRI